MPLAIHRTAVRTDEKQGLQSGSIVVTFSPTAGFAIYLGTGKDFTDSCNKSKGHKQQIFVKESTSGN